MISGELKKAKRDVRRRVLALRDGLSPQQREVWGSRAVERLLGLPQLAGPEVVMAFWSFGSEIETSGLIESLVSRGVKVALPRIEGPDIRPLLWEPGAPTTKASFGAREPVTGPDGAVVAPETIDVVIVPAVAYDRAGRRVGYGGGYYDRFLPTTRGDILRVGLGFDVQLVDEDLPSGAFDSRVDVVVTTSQTVSCGRS